MMKFPSIKRKFKVRIFLRGGQIAKAYFKEFSTEVQKDNDLIGIQWEGSTFALSYTRLDSVDRIEATVSWRFYVDWG